MVIREKKTKKRVGVFKIYMLTHARTLGSVIRPVCRGRQRDGGSGTRRGGRNRGDLPVLPCR